MPVRTLIAVCLTLAAVATIAVACKSGGNNGGQATEGPATVTQEPATSGTTPTDIRQEHWAAQPGLKEFVGSSGGEVDTARIVYTDLTGDGIDDAVVPVSSGGEGGDIAVFVYGYKDGALQELLRVTPQGSSLVADTSPGALRITEPVFAQGDPLCCPSQLRRTTYGWDGSQFSVVDVETVPAEGTP